MNDEVNEFVQMVEDVTDSLEDSQSAFIRCMNVSQMFKI